MRSSGKRRKGKRRGRGKTRKRRKEKGRGKRSSGKRRSGRGNRRSKRTIFWFKIVVQ